MDDQHKLLGLAERSYLELATEYIHHADRLAQRDPDECWRAIIKARDALNSIINNS